MGNKLTSQGWKAKKRKNASFFRRKKAKDKIISYEIKGGLEIEDVYEVEEEVDEVDEVEEKNFKSKADYTTRNKDCGKACRHGDYTPFESLKTSDLPEPIRHPAIFDYIKATGNLVVFISVREKSPARQDNKNKVFGHRASGFACVCEEETVEGECPDPRCPFGSGEEKPHKVYGGILVMTNRHVIIDDFECEHSEFLFFYENGEPHKVKVKGSGFCLRDDSSEIKDYVGVKIYLHDASVVEQIRQFSSDAALAWQRIPSEIQMEFENHAVVISHPHNWPKQVSFGRLLVKEQLVDDNDTEYEGSSDDIHAKHNTEDSSSNRNIFNDNNNDFKLNEIRDPSVVRGVHGVTHNKNKRKERWRVSRYTSMTCQGSSGSPVLTGFYWNNPFIHSSGFVKTVKIDGKSKDDEAEEEDKRLEIWGESYFY